MTASPPISQPFRISQEQIAQHNDSKLKNLKRDFEYLGEKLNRTGVDIESITSQASAYKVAIPSWGVGTGGTRFGRFPGQGEPRNIMEKMEDCGTIHQLTRLTPTVSLHFPWDRPESPESLMKLAQSLELEFDAVNSNTFQDQKNQAETYKFGSLSHTSQAVRDQAIAHNVDCIELGKKLGSKALTVWVGDGSNFAGQQHFTRALDRYLDSMKQVYKTLPEDWRIFLEHKLFEPAFYSTIISDWGSSYWSARELGEKAFCLVDLGHHAPNVNIEMVVARLIHFEKLGGFHLNDSKYGDDDLDAASVKPFQLFLVFNELVDAVYRKAPKFNPAYMLDQSHNVTDPIESLMNSGLEAQRAYVKALLIDRPRLEQFQEDNDALGALTTLKEAFHLDVSPILSMSSYRQKGAIDPIGAYRFAEYREKKGEERPADFSGRAGIV